jgi:hypothetical protein
MIKKILVSAILCSLALEANASLVAGDISFTAYNADEDGWAITTFKDIDANTAIYFTDNEWNGGAIGAGGAFNTGESYFKWNSGSSIIAAGSVVRFSSVDNVTSLASSAGTFTRAAVTGSTNYGLSQTADSIYAYLGSAANQPTTFLTAISTGGFSAAEGQLANTDLSVGVNAVQLKAGSDYAEYIGDRSAQPSFDDYRPLVSNVTLWDDKGDGSFAALAPNTTAFTVAAVPVPAAAWLFSSALAGLGLVNRRKNQHNK